MARCPRAHGHIPNFVGAEAAARHLTTLDAWLAARTIKSNPDAPQRPVRYAALNAGKVVYLAVPCLRTLAPFIELDPHLLDEEVPIVTTVHPLLIVTAGDIEMTRHDISLNWIATPQGILRTDGRYPRPPGVLWDELGEKVDEIPVLQDLATRRRR
jgi:5-formyltetrahydrofolate cyclo-ligase